MLDGQGGSTNVSHRSVDCDVIKTMCYSTRYTHLFYSRHPWTVKSEGRKIEGVGAAVVGVNSDLSFISNEVWKRHKHTHLLFTSWLHVLCPRLAHSTCPHLVTLQKRCILLSFVSFLGLPPGLLRSKVKESFSAAYICRWTDNNLSFSSIHYWLLKFKVVYDENPIRLKSLADANAVVKS